MSKLHISTSPLTNRIFVGRVSKDGKTWSQGKQDITGAACGAVCEYVLQTGGPVTVACNGKPRFLITVTEIAPQAKGD